MPIAPAGRGADREEDAIRAIHRLIEVGGEAQPAIRLVFRHEPVEPRFIDRDHPAPQRRDLLRVGIDDTDIDAELGEARAGNQADIAGAEDRNPHLYTLPLKDLLPVSVPRRSIRCNEGRGFRAVTSDGVA